MEFCLQRYQNRELLQIHHQNSRLHTKMSKYEWIQWIFNFMISKLIYLNFIVPETKKKLYNHQSKIIHFLLHYYLTHIHPFKLWTAPKKKSIKTLGRKKMRNIEKSSHCTYFFDVARNVPSLRSTWSKRTMRIERQIAKNVSIYLREKRRARTKKA